MTSWGISIQALVAHLLNKPEYFAGNAYAMRQYLTLSWLQAVQMIGSTVNPQKGSSPDQLLR